MLKQKMALLLAAAMLAGAVSGCSNSQQGGEVSADSGASAQSEGSSQAENQEPVTIKFVGYANSAAGFEARAEEFMSQRSDIKVEVQGIPANSWGELMQAISVNIAAMFRISQISPARARDPLRPPVLLSRLTSISNGIRKK